MELYEENFKKKKRNLYRITFFCSCYRVSILRNIISFKDIKMYDSLSIVSWAIVKIYKLMNVCVAVMVKILFLFLKENYKNLKLKLSHIQGKLYERKKV